MLRVALFFFLIFHFGSGLAQPVLNAPSFPPNGYAADLFVGAFIEPTEGSEEAQNWDFSGVNGNVFNTLGVEQASTSLYAPMFPQAEWVLSNGDALSFVTAEEEDFVVFGNANMASGAIVPFEDPLVQWSFPLELGLSHEDTFSSEQLLFNEPYSLQGNVTAICDAWGSIVLPNGTGISEVLRYDYNMDYEEIYAGDTAIYYLNQVMYFAPDSTLPVFYQEQLVVTNYAGEELINATDVAWYENAVLGVNEEAVVGPTAWPNPIHAGGDLSLDGARSGAFVMDLGGRTVWVLEEIPSGVLQVSTEDWKSGPYLYVPFKGAHPIRIIVQ